jgi:molybdopterin synthase catalytic subunit
MEGVSSRLFEITTQKLSVDGVVARVADASVGAVAVFVGVARDNTDGHEVRYLEYEHYPGMAEDMLQQIADEICDRWAMIDKVAIVHRVGRVEPGEISAVIVLSASHREEVFDALRFAVDRLKQVVPIWKKEVWSDGA